MEHIRHTFCLQKTPGFWQAANPALFTPSFTMLPSEGLGSCQPGLQPVTWVQNWVQFRGSPLSQGVLRYD